MVNTLLLPRHASYHAKMSVSTEPELPQTNIHVMFLPQVHDAFLELEYCHGLTVTGCPILTHAGTRVHRMVFVGSG